MRDLSLAANLAIFAVGAGAVWWAGTRLEPYADVIAVRTGSGSVLGVGWASAAVVVVYLGGMLVLYTM